MSLVVLDEADDDTVFRLRLGRSFDGASRLCRPCQHPLGVRRDEAENHFIMRWSGYAVELEQDERCRPRLLRSEEYLLDLPITDLTSNPIVLGEPEDASVEIRASFEVSNEQLGEAEGSGSHM